MFPTRHAIERFQQRVAPVTTAEAARRIREAAAGSTPRTTPKRWTPVAPAADLVFLYPETLPGVCLLTRNGAVITVVERSQARAWKQAARSGRSARRPSAYERPTPGDLLWEAA